MPAMPSKKRILLTVNPALMAGKRLSTIRSIVTALDAVSDLWLVPVDGYDFKNGKIATYRRVKGGRFQKHSLVKPRADFWIVYSDGYWLNHIEHGFKKRLDFLNAQMFLHQSSLDGASVSMILNAPEAEKNCLKDWMVSHKSPNSKIIPTYLASDFLEIHDLLRKHGTLVAKPKWGGSGFGIKKLESDIDLTKLKSYLADAGTALDEYCFQNYVTGPEKRLWIVDGQCVAARITHGRHTPWSPDAADFRVSAYTSDNLNFREDKLYAELLCKQSQLKIGSVDFIGDCVNELNGAGTTFIQYDGANKIVDARALLVDYLVSLALSK